MGSKETLFQMYLPDDFTDALLRRVWRWLYIRFVEDDCTIWDYSFSDPVAPKYSVLADCITESLIQKEDNNFYTLNEILNHD